jgi:hypothetical protein
MNMTEASCGHAVFAVGAPNSKIRQEIENTPCVDCRDEHPYEQHLKQHSIKRSPEWPHFRHAVIDERGHKCEISGETSKLELHHIIPFHFGVLLDRPYIELDRRNVIVISSGPINYHLLFGHLDDYRSYNVNVRLLAPHAHDDPSFWTTAEWQKLIDNRPKSWQAMDSQDKCNLRSLIDRLYPR